MKNILSTSRTTRNHNRNHLHEDTSHNDINDNDTTTMNMMEHNPNTTTDAILEPTTTPPIHLYPIPLPFHHLCQRKDTCDIDDDDDEILFEPAIPFDTKGDETYMNTALPHNTTASTTFDEEDRFYYADEATLYSITENSREDTIDNTTTTNHTVIYSLYHLFKKPPKF